MPVPQLTGVVHLPAVPGDPFHDGCGFDGALDFARRDAAALAEGGIGAIIVENFGSKPFPKGDALQPSPPWQVAWIARAALMILQETGLLVGVNVLRNDAQSALGIAAATGAGFVRVNVHAGSAWTDQGLIEGQAAQTLRTRAALGAASVSILADVRVKHAAPVTQRPLADEVQELVHRAGADAVIVTGSGTGQPVDERVLAQVAEAAAGAPVLIGSGLSPERAHLAKYAQGAIVGTWIKEDGRVERPVDPERVRRLVQAWGAAV
ncbi:MAG: BtpA/SgcQ family protein [Myxococcota bacterium]